jgi:phosphomethylpyrimidine synthase
MKITQDVRDYAATLNDPAGVGVLTKEEGMAQMSQKFRDMGEQVYVDAERVKASNRSLG